MATPKEFVWSKESYSIRELLNKFGNKFPIIVQVTGGYCGQDEIETLSSGQVARIHEQGEQRRVLAMDTKGRYLSIPGDYPIKFEVVKNGKKSHRGRTLLDIVRDNKLPVTVQIEHRRTWLFDVGAVKYKSSDFGILELLGTYKQHFLKVNTIHEGVIDGKVTFVPLYVDVELRIAQGIKNATDFEWDELTDMYSRAVAHIDFKKTKGNTSIMLYPAKVSDPDWEVPTATARIPSNESTSGYSSVLGHSYNGRSGTNNDGRTSQATDTSASIVRMLPNMTLVMNLNKDELTSSLGRPTPSPRLESPFRPSNLSDIATESDRKSLRSDGDTDDTSSTLTDTDSSTKLQNVVRLKLGGGNKTEQHRRTVRRNRSRSRSRSKTPPRQITSPTNSVKPGRVQAIGAPVAVFNDQAGEYNVTFPIRRAASLESMQDAYPSDAETTSSSMGVVPRYLKAKSANYGMRFLKKSDREKVYSHSNPDLTADNFNTLQPPQETPYPAGVMTTGRIPTRKAVSFSNADTLTGVREVYMTNNLQVTVMDQDQSNLVTYTRRPGMERASKVAFRSVSRSNSPVRSASPVRSVSPYNSLPRARPYVKPVPTQVNYRSATLPPRPPPKYEDILNGRGVTSVAQTREYRTAPLKSSPALQHRVLSSNDQNWELRNKNANTNTLSSDTTASVNSETDSDVIYQGTLTLKRQQNGSFQAQRSMYQMLATQGKSSNYGTLNSSRDSTPTPPQEYDPMAWANQEWQRMRHTNPSSQIQNIPIEYDSDIWMPPQKPNGNVTMTQTTQRYEQHLQNGWSSANSSLDRNAMTRKDDGFMQVQEIKSGDGTVIRHEVVHENAANKTNGHTAQQFAGQSKFGMRYAPADINGNFKDQNGYQEARHTEAEVVKSASPPPLITITSENEENVPPAKEQKKTETVERKTEEKKSSKKEKVRTDSVNSLRDAMNKYGSLNGSPKMSAAASSETFTEAANRTIERYKKKKAKQTDVKPTQLTNGHASGDEIEKIQDSIRDLDDYLQTVDNEDDQRHYVTL